MKKISLALLLAFVFININKASGLEIRHVKGLHYAGGSFSYVIQGYNVDVNYGYYFNNYFGLELRFEYEDGDLNLGEYNSYNFYGEVYYTLLASEKYFLSTKLGIINGIESVRNEILEKQKQYYQYGLATGLKLEYYLNNRFKTQLDIEPRILPNREIGLFDLKARIGINVNI